MNKKKKKKALGGDEFDSKQFYLAAAIFQFLLNYFKFLI